MGSDFYSRYTVISKIGEGTFSEVLKCREIVTDRICAVKKLKKHYKNLSEAKSLTELEVLQKLSPHINVLTLNEYIFDSKEGKLYLCFELMEMSLYELIQSRRRTLPESKVKNIFYQILKGLEHLHSHGIFHRDIKPENILIKKNIVKLADLGSVRGVHSAQPYTEYISTRWYRAPECILTSGTYGSKMDVWACGCVFFELLTSKPLFPGSNEVDQLTRIHQCVGTPNPRVMMKMRRHRSRVGDVKFTLYPGISLGILLPFTSEAGRELLKRMLIYDPDIRSNVRRLLEHRYFNDLRETEFLSKLHAPKQWSSPGMLSLLTNDKKIRAKPEVKTFEKKKTSAKLTTNSWAPSTNTSKIILVQSKSKPSNDIAPTIKKKPGQSPVRALRKNSTSPTKLPVKQAAKKTISVKPDTKLFINDTKIATRQNKIKTSSLGILPGMVIKNRGDSIKISKSQICGSNLKAIKKSFLPPILEQ